MVAGGGAGAYVWWTAGLRPFTWPALLAVAAAGTGTIVLGTRRRRPFEPGAHATSALIWGIIFALLVGWELAAYFQHPRADHPTLSVLAEPLIDGRPARALAFSTWIAVGAYLCRR